MASCPTEDADGDGYRTMEVVESIDEDCQDEGEASLEAPLVDCDDTRDGVHPGADEIPGDGVDQDCDGEDPAGPEDTGGTSVVVNIESDEDGTGDGDVAKAGCGCTTASQDPLRTLWILPLMGLVGLRRRKAA